MKSVIVLGGYGGFGARLSRRLAADGWKVLIAGRRGEAARMLAASLPNAEGLVADRNENLSDLLRRHRPFLLIDAAGPFQSSDYRVIKCCIANGVHYLDLADARDFVRDITTLDEAARSAGVVVVAGASSVPALSSAVVAKLAADFDEVQAICLSISASSRSAAGASVTTAILSTVGQPVPLWIGRAWQTKAGWQQLRHESYVVPGRRPLHRLVALADVPDHDLLPQTVSGRPATIFRAGPEFAFQLLGLWLLSWLVRWGVVRSTKEWGRWLSPLQRWTSRGSSERSAMAVELKGKTAGDLVVCRWTLIAEQGDGPEIPTMAAQLIARAIREGRLAHGARPACGLLHLESFQALFAERAITQDIKSRSYMPLYQRIMGERFTALPAPVRAIHAIVGDGGASGIATVTRGKSLLANLIAKIVGFPPAGTHPVHVSFAEERGTEFWTRNFAGHSFSSRLSQSGEHLAERFGPLRFTFSLPSDASGLTMVMRRWSLFGIRLPLRLAPQSAAREWAEGDDFVFDVPIALPMIGLIVHYRGRLRRL